MAMPPPAAGGAAQPMQQPMPGATPRRYNLGAKDPLLKKGHAKVYSHGVNKENTTTPPSERIYQLTLLSVVSFAIYTFMLFFTTFRFYYSPVVVELVFCILLGVCVMQYLVVEHCYRKSQQKWKKGIGRLGAMATIAGLLVGLCIHYKWMLFHAKYTNMMKYSNVAASQPALQFEDAGSLLFTEGTAVDRTRAVGFRNIRTSSTLCVAPVVDGQMGQTDSVVFFAVGVNCCGWRSSFECGDAAVSGTRGGLLMLEPDMLVSPAMEWAVDGVFDFKGFEEAIELQKSVFAVTAAKNYRLVAWVKDPLAKIDDFRKRGKEAAFASCGAFLIVAGFIIAQNLFAEDQKQKDRATAMMKGSGV